MEIQSTRINSTAFKAQNTNPEEKKSQTTEPIKNGDKKLNYALAGLAAIGIAGIGIGIAIKKGKKPKTTQKITETLSDAAQKPDKKAADKMNKKTQSITQEALERTKNEKIKKEAAQKAQEHYTELAIGKQANKSAKESAEVFKEFFKEQDLQEQIRGLDALEAATGPKSYKSAKESAQVFIKEFEPQTPQEEKLLELVTGKKAGAKAHDYQEMWEDLCQKQESKALDELLTGKKTNLDAFDSAFAFADIPQTMSEKMADVFAWKGKDFLPNRKVEQKLKKLPPKAAQMLTHRDIIKLLETPNNSKSTKAAIKQLDRLSKNFSK